MGKRINLREYWSKKAAQGRMGDSEMRVVKGEAAHVNPVEADIIDRHGKAGEEIVTQIGSGTINPKTGYREYAFPWLALGAAAVKLGKSAINRKQQKDLIKKQKQILGEQKKAALASLDKAGQLTGEEQAAFARMQRGAEEGTMDVDALNQQMAQPLYQQGETQEAMQQAQITQQGLEGSIIAQDVSRKVGADVRASIAEQARGIAFANEKTKADAERRLQDAKMRRGQMLRDIAMKKSDVERATAAEIGNLRVQDLASKQSFSSGLLDSVGGFGASYLSEQGGNFGEFMGGVSSVLNPQTGSNYGGITLEELLNNIQINQGTNDRPQ
tara:strand:+ start:126 stop:1109 length:984 start_codon:yes stop_codon:yes gene_type:complete